MIDMREKNLLYYGGNYDSYHKTRAEQEVNQMKAYHKQQVSQRRHSDNHDC